MPEEHFSNPLAPPDHYVPGNSSKQPLRNEDFRRLLTTPRVSSGSVSSVSARVSTDETPSFTHHRPAAVNDTGASGGSGGGPKTADGAKEKRGKGTSKGGGRSKGQRRSGESGADDDEADELGDILKNYRDRARERRDGETKGPVDTADMIQLTSGYRALPRDARSATNAAERRRQLIQESKYLGGDMEHTHLVKGLDYSLLQKVRSEIVSKDEDEDQLEDAYQNTAKKDERQLVQQQIKHNMAKAIYRVLFADELDKNQPVKRNELFAPRRMAYVIELDDEFSQSDLPTTLIRSKADCPVDESTTNLSTNDMVIQKLTQVLSYLRTDTKRKKKEKLEISKEDRDKLAAQNIYDDAGDYVPNVRRDKNAGGRRAADDGDRARDRRYFDEKKKTDDDSRGGNDRRDRRISDRPTEKNVGSTADARLSQGWAPADLALQQQRQNTAAAISADVDAKRVAPKTDRDPLKGRDDHADGIGLASVAADSYAECYPGGLGDFAGNESDEEGADYSKMDMGNKKGPIRRWDFDTDEQYEEYMSGREAMPRAAFQFGVKMEGGRKTRKMGGGASGTGDQERDRKQKLDREWDQISRIIAKRKGGETEGEAKKKK